MSHRAQINQQDSSFSLQNGRRTIQRWTTQQNLLYAQFLLNDLSNGNRRALKKNRGMFQRMSKFVGTRTNIQCRSHHVKMLKLNHSVETVVGRFLRSNEKQRNEEPIQRDQESLLDFPEVRQNENLQSMRYFSEEIRQVQSYVNDGRQEDSYFPQFQPPNFS